MTYKIREKLFVCRKKSHKRPVLITFARIKYAFRNKMPIFAIKI